MNLAALQALRQPLAVSDTWLRALMDSIVSNPSAIMASPQPVDAALSLSKYEDVAVIKIDGPLSKDPGFWSYFGFKESTYSGIRCALQLAISDSSVNSIVLEINSPGGEVYGCAELCADIFSIRGTKPIVAYISGQGDSAAYWLASACDRIVINESAEAGSIGVRCVLVDYTKFEECVGIKSYDIVADQSPFKVVDASDAADRARVKAQMTSFASVFVGEVAENRGVSVDTVLSEFGKGDVFIGADSVGAGLADEVGSLESVVYAESSAERASAMLIQKNAAAAAPNDSPSASVGNGKCSSCKADMDDGDPMYCKACKGDSASASAFVAAVSAVVGENDPAKLIGAITGFKAQAAKVAELETLLAAERKKSADAEVKGILDAACSDGRIKPAAREQFEKLYADHGKSALAASLAVLTPAPAPAIPGSDEASRKAAAEAAPAPGAKTAPKLSAEELAVIKKTGGDPEKFLAHKQRLAAITHPSEEN